LDRSAPPASPLAAIVDELGIGFEQAFARVNALVAIDRASAVVSDLPSDHHTTADALTGGHVLALPLLLIPFGGFAGRRTRQ
jgi:hypothetical protein